MRHSCGHSSITASAQEGVEAIDRLIGPVLEQAAVAGQSEGHAVVAGPLGDLADVAAGSDQDGDEAVPQTVEGEAVEAGATNSGPPRLAGESRAEKRAAASRREDQGIRLWLDVIGEVLLIITERATGQSGWTAESWAPGPI